MFLLAPIVADEIAELLTQFVWINPHLTFRIDGKSVIDWNASNPDWTKYRACDASSAHWYPLEQFERYAGALIDRDRKITVREFAAQFRGLSATERQKRVVHPLDAASMPIKQQAMDLHHPVDTFVIGRL